MSAQRYSVNRWIKYHSFAVFSTFILAIVLESTIPLIVSGTLSFGYLILQHQQVELPERTLSFWQMAPNWVTFIRVIAILVIGLVYPMLTPFFIGLIGLIILISDKVDGYLAETKGMKSFFGAQFDQETDAFYITMYAFILYLDGYMGIWILALGLLRYLNIIVLVLFNQQHKPEPRFLGARLVATMVMIALLIPFVTPSWLFTPFAAISVLFLIGSFSYTFTYQVLQPG